VPDPVLQVGHPVVGGLVHEFALADHADRTAWGVFPVPPGEQVVDAPGNGERLERRGHGR
jgi:hypothetical protein